MLRRPETSATFVLVLISDCEFLQRIERTVENIEVYISLYAGQLSCVGVLPEVPRALVFHLIYIVMRYPVGIVVEYGCVQIVLLKFIICVYDRLHVVFVLYDVQPCKNVALEIFHIAVLRLVLHVEHRRKVAVLQSHLFQEEVSLVASRRFVAPEVIGSANQSVFASLTEVLLELVVGARRTLGRLYHDEAQRVALDIAVAQLVPVDGALII